MKLSKGFTIIELVVVMAVFLFIIGAAISIFISVVQSQKKVLSEQQLVNQISYTEEYMSKALRMATADTTGSCLGSGNKGYIYLLTPYDNNLSVFKGIKFLNQSNNICQQFVWDNANGVLEEIKNGGTAVPLTSTSLKINFTRFSINGSNGSTFTSDTNPGSNSCSSTLQCGASNADTVQPRVTIVMNINVAGDSQEPIRTIQTTVSQRNLNAKQ